jgi:hypothetical protein
MASIANIGDAAWLLNAKDGKDRNARWLPLAC